MTAISSRHNPWGHSGGTIEVRVELPWDRDEMDVLCVPSASVLPDIVGAPFPSPRNILIRNISEGVDMCLVALVAYDTPEWRTWLELAEQLNARGQADIRRSWAAAKASETIRHTEAAP